MTPSITHVAGAACSIQTEAAEFALPPAGGGPSGTDRVVFFSLVTGTRGYIEQIVHQINGTYEHGWYDACAVMIRRLVETLIIEAYEKHGLSSNIQNANGNYLYLGDLVARCLAEPAWALGRNAKQALPKLKDVGDRSAHSRRFLAHRKDIDSIQPALRIVVQELLILSGLKQ